MRKIKFANNATTTLAANISAVATTVNVTPGSGSKFPSLVAGEYFMATAVNALGNIEIMKVTARSGDSMTVERAAETVAGAATAYAFQAGDRFEMRWTAQGVGGELDRLDGAALPTAMNKAVDYTVAEADIHNLIRVDTGAAPRSITLPLISSLTDDFDIIITKVSSDSNTLTITASGTDKINGAAYYAFTTQWQSAWLIADRATGAWTAINSAGAGGGGGSGAIVSDTFTGNGVTTTYTLSANPGDIDNVHATVGGVYQTPEVAFTWAGGTSIQFTAAPPNGAEIYVWQNSTSVVSVPAIPSPVGQENKHLSNNGADLIWVSPNDFGINALNFIPEAQRAAIRAGTSTYDATADLQNAINAAANSWTRKVFFPAGRYYIPGNKKLRTYYDSVNNAGYPRNRNAHIELIGEGMDSEANGSGAPGLLCGTLFWSDPSTVRTEPFLEVSPTSEDALPYYGRDFVARDLSFDGNRAGHLVFCRGVPGARFVSCQIRQRNAGGSGLYLSTTYFGAVDGCRFDNNGVGTKTGDAITLNGTIDAGLYELSNRVNVQNFGHGLHIVGGSIQSLTCYGAELSGASGGITVEDAGWLQNLTMVSPYFEGGSAYWIKDAGASGNRIRSLNIIGGFGYGAGLSGAAIQLNKPDTVDIQGMLIQDLAGTFMNISAAPSGSHAPYRVSSMMFYYTGAISTLRTLFTGVIPALENIEWPEGNANCRLHTTGNTPIRMRPLFSADSSMMEAGHFRETSVQVVSPASAGTTYYHSVLGYASTVVMSTTSGTVTLELNKGSTAALGDNFHLVVINKGAGTLNVTRATLGTTIVSLAANTKTWLRWSTLFDDWL